MHSFFLTLDICVRFRLLCSRWYQFDPINWKSGINHYVVKIQLCQRLILLNSSMTLLIQIQCGRSIHFIRNLITECIQFQTVNIKSEKCEPHWLHRRSFQISSMPQCIWILQLQVRNTKKNTHTQSVRYTRMSASAIIAA